MPAMESCADEFTPQALSEILRTSAWIGTHWYVVDWIADCRQGNQEDFDESLAEALEDEDSSLCNEFTTLRESIYSRQGGIELPLTKVCSLLDKVSQFENIVVTGSVAPLVIAFPYHKLLYECGDITIEFRDSTFVFVSSRHPELLSLFRSAASFKDLGDDEFFNLGPW